MKSTPAFILRNCAFWANEDLKVGQVPELVIPIPKVVTDEAQNAGMIKKRHMSMGSYELGELTFNMVGMDPAAYGLLSGKPGSENPYMATGALADEDGTTNNATFYCRGIMSEVNPGTWKPGERNDSEFTILPNYARLEIAGAEIFQIDDFDYSLNGVSQTGDIRSALLLD